MKTRAKYLAAAAVMAVTAASGAFAGVPVSAEEKEARRYPTAMTEDRNSKEYKDFISTAPEIKVTNPYDYYTRQKISHQYLSWEPVEGALFYYFYETVGKKLKHTKTYLVPQESILVEVGKTYMVKAVTYDTADCKILSAESKIKIAAPEQSSVQEYDKWFEKKYGCKYDEYEEEEEEEDYDYEEYEEYVEEEEPEIVEEEEFDGGIFTNKKPPRIEVDEEAYAHYDENTYKRVTDTPLSTISADVDTASYSNARRMIVGEGRWPAKDSVRTEEFLNYFDYNYDQPQKNPFTVTYELSDCPWNKEAQLLMVGIQAKDLEKEPNSNLVFLVDVSGSMYSQDKLPLVKDSINQLSKQMTKDDRLSIVTYSGAEKVLISGATGNMTKCIKELTDLMEAYGCTNGEAGINMAYELAEQNYIKDGSNRVIMATDGDLNVGISSASELSEFITEKRKTGVYLTVLGYGTGNLKDDSMEALAKDGNGNYHYIDSAAEAQKVLVDERKSTLITAADDVKIQIEFNPNVISRYRLIGYEGRRLEAEDFVDDTKDAADVGAGQSVTVMYELLPSKGEGNTLKYMKKTGNGTDVCTVKLRYKNPGSEKSVQSKVVITKDKYQKYAAADVRFRFAACVAETAMVLKGETSYGNPSIAAAKKRYDAIKKSELKTIGYSDDFTTLIEKAAELESKNN